MARQAGPLAQQVAQADALVGQRVGEAEVGQMLADRVVKRQLAIVGQHGDKRRGKGFGTGCEWKNRVGGDGFGLAQLADTVAFEIHRMLAVDDNDGRPRHIPIGQGGLDDRVGAGFGQGRGVRHGNLAGEWQQQCQQRRHICPPARKRACGILHRPMVKSSWLGSVAVDAGKTAALAADASAAEAAAEATANAALNATLDAALDASAADEDAAAEAVDAGDAGTRDQAAAEAADVGRRIRTCGKPMFWAGFWKFWPTIWRPPPCWPPIPPPMPPEMPPWMPPEMPPEMPPAIPPDTPPEMPPEMPPVTPPAAPEMPEVLIEILPPPPVMV